MEIVVRRRKDLENKTQYIIDCIKCGSTLKYTSDDVDQNSRIECPVCHNSQLVNKSLTYIKKVVTCPKCKFKLNYNENDIITNENKKYLYCINCNNKINLL